MNDRLKRFGRTAIERLRRIRGEDAAPESEVRLAARRVFSTPDGQTLLNWMLAQSYSRPADPAATESALRENEARKRFFDQILALGEEPSDRTDGHVSDTASGRRASRRRRSADAG